MDPELSGDLTFHAGSVDATSVGTTCEVDRKFQDSLTDESWYVLQAKPRQESRVTFHLHKRLPSLEVFVPLMEVPQKRRGRKLNLLEPLFPGYLFATIPPDPSTWTVVRWTPGVKHILGCGEIPVPVPSGLIVELKAKVAEHGFVRPGIPFVPGERVRLREGPFAGLEGIFERELSPAGRVRVLVQLLSRTTPIDVDVLELEQP